MKARILFLAVTFLTTTSFAGYKEIFERRLFEAKAQEHQKFLKLLGEDTSAPEQVFTQRLNHDDPQDQRTFPQRYWVNSSYVVSSNAPVLLFLCGEWTCGTSDLNVLLPYAKKLKAHMVAMEHRYYGKSHPFPLLTAENLKFLTTPLALADFAALEKYLQGTGLQGKWFVVGGSYSASLAAYYRLKYPTLAVGAWASSGPVKAKENFEEYDLHVATVAGPQCAASMRTVVKKVEQALANPVTAQQMKQLFQAETLTDDVDFLYLIADMGALAMQYGFRDEFCQFLSEPDPLQGYAKFVAYIFSNWGLDALSGSAAGAMSLNPDDYENFAGMRQWFYQSCTEYGYWQNAYHDEAVTVRSTRINPEYHTGICRRLFGIEKPVNTEAINKELYEPLLKPEVTQIIFTNGSQDPWSKLSITPDNGNAVNPNTITYVIKDAAHCDDLAAPSSFDSDALKEARKLVEDRAQAWLSL